MSIGLGIIGLPQSGKTTVFNALTRGEAATAAAQSPGKPNLGIAKVPDPRLDILMKMFEPQRLTPAEVQYFDLPIYPEEKSKTRGIGGQMLNTLQQSDALLLVVRAFKSPSVPHPEGTVDPYRDLASMQLELAFSDLTILERREQRLQKDLKAAKAGDRDRIRRDHLLISQLKDGLEADIPIREQSLSSDEQRSIAGYQFLTEKPLLIMFNIDEGQLDLTPENSNSGKESPPGKIGHSRACLRSLIWQWVCRQVYLRSEINWGDTDMPLRPMGREQMWMLPPTLDELLPLDHPARFVAEFVDALGRDAWAELGVDIDGEVLGAPAYHPRALLSVWLYGFMTGVRSCQKLEAACRDQIPYLWLTGWQHPDHNTLWRFYKGHRHAMRKLFERSVRTAVAMALVDLAVQAVDGTKVVANASVNRSYDAVGLSGLLERLEKEIADLEAQNEGGEDAPVAHLPKELADKEVLRDRVRQAMADLGSQKRHKRINLTDPEARLMKGRQGIVAGYNAQAMVSPMEIDGEAAGMVVTAVDVVDAANDNALLVPMVEQAEETTGTRVPMTLADAGYFAVSHLAECDRRGQQVVVSEARQRFLTDAYHKDRFTYDEQSDSFTCPQGRRLKFLRIQHTNGVPLRLYRASGAVCQACPAFGVCTRARETGPSLAIGPHDGVLRRHRAWRTTLAAKEAYRLRKQLVEPVFGIIKEQQRARRFLLRGLANVAAEWTMLATAFNLRTLYRVWSSSLHLQPST